MNYNDRRIIDLVLDTLEEGVHVVDENGISIIYNRAMSSLEMMNQNDVLGKPFREVFNHIPEGESTLMEALSHGKEVSGKQQTYLNRDGRQVTTVNTTLPVVEKEQGRVIAAVEIARNVTSIQDMSHKILALQKEVKDPKKAQEKKLKKYNFENVWGRAPAFEEVIAKAKKAAGSSASVLIYGETGTGKELVAQSIHYDGERREKPFIAQNCAALPEGLLEGILFGTAKGGFTGAVDRAGIFEQASGGTLLLDEVNSMPYQLQGKLLRVLQEDYIRRVGGVSDIPVDVRIIATVNEKPDVLLGNGRLRKDLFYRLNIIQLNVPPLRERREDILFLADKFIEKHCEKQSIPIKKLNEKAKAKLLDFDYPGNVRQLENIIMGALSLVDREDQTSQLEEKHIQIDKKEIPYVSGEDIRKEEGLEHYLSKIEKEMIEHAMAVSGGNITKAAGVLQIKRQNLQHKLKRHGL